MTVLKRRLNPDRRSAGRIFDCIVEKIPDRLSQRFPVRADRRQSRIDLQIDAVSAVRDNLFKLVDEGVEQGILLFGNGTEPKTLDPQRATGVPENHIISALIEGLITYHPTDDNLPEPGMADRWESNEDASIWTFHIRDNALWSNGDPVTSHDFVYTYKRMLAPGFRGLMQPGQLVHPCRPETLSVLSEAVGGVVDGACVRRVTLQSLSCVASLYLL